MIDVQPAFIPISDRPIFRLDQPEFTAFYAPGCLCVTERAAADGFAARIGRPGQSEPDGWNTRLWQAADRALRDFERLAREPFLPECLTLYLNNECNLNCVYCYATPLHQPSARLDINAVAAAAEVVAATCNMKQLPFTVVFHGGGEPTLYPDDAEAILVTLDQIAQTNGVELFRYISTNGIMSRQRAIWLASRFDLVSLSCDGPPDIQDQQRPRVGGGNTSMAILQTARLLRERGCAFQTRTTITAATLHRQTEIVEYLCQHLAPQAIQFEPVYVSDKDAAGTQLARDQARAFVQHFLAARDVARSYGIPLNYTGSRLGTIHGPYCHIFRQVINLVPPGIATACFKIAYADDIKTKQAAIGALDARTSRFQIDHARIQRLRDHLHGIPASCASCFNRFHCVRQCPDACPLDSDTAAESGGFRCHVQKTLAEHTLRALAGNLWAELRAQRSRNTGDFAFAHGTTTF